MHKILTHEQIAKRAYQIYLNRGGDAVANWFQAHRELEQEAEAAEAKEAAEIAEVERQRRIQEKLWPKES